MPLHQHDSRHERNNLAPAPASVHRGQLRFFFGGSRGRTAVRHMLESAVASRRAGVDVVIGRMNAKASDQLDHLLRGLEHLPNLKPAVGMGQIDVAGAIRRRPSVLLVDTRPPAFIDTARGSITLQNYDCWSEIDTIAEAGIVVWAAVDASGFSSWGTVGPGLPVRITGDSLL